MVIDCFRWEQMEKGLNTVTRIPSHHIAPPIKSVDPYFNHNYKSEYCRSNQVGLSIFVKLLVISVQSACVFTLATVLPLQSSRLINIAIGCCLLRKVVKEDEVVDHVEICAMCV